ncbi:MAG: PilT/PilU family type 4a pilus ATPase [Candidatus Omnitrophica bacterium]|nr:PilT/PilU family type 4a pilus ATPase [Candidatus Omnitrophota bacterium]
MLEELVKTMQEKKATSMHMSAGLPALFNIAGRLIPGNSQKIDARQIDHLADSLMNSAQAKVFAQDNSVNFTYVLDSLGRIRVSFYKQKGFTNALFRTLSENTPTIPELNLPENINKLSELKKGLVILGGPAGCGKTSTLSAILDALNKKRGCHIITLENPIEYFFQPIKSLFSQREVGTDCISFPCALREAIRQDADVIVINEMRDMETIRIALEAAETGILVFATMSTTDCIQTITRLVGAFPANAQHQIRTQLAISLQSIVCQQLVMRHDNSGRVPALEIMHSNQAIQNLIREKKYHQIYSAIESGKEQGMQTLDQALQKLYQKNIISDLEVVTKSVKPEQSHNKLIRNDIPSPEEIASLNFIDLGEEMIPLENKMIKYRSNFTPGQESYWTSSASVVFQDPGMILTKLASSGANRFYISDFNIVSKKVSPFELPHRLLLRFKIEYDPKNIPDIENHLVLKLFTLPEKDKPTSFVKTNSNYPMELNDRWHTCVINIPPEAVGKLLKIVMFEFPEFLTKVLISDIIFF